MSLSDVSMRMARFFPERGIWRVMAGQASLRVPFFFVGRLLFAFFLEEVSNLQAARQHRHNMPSALVTQNPAPDTKREPEMSGSSPNPSQDKKVALAQNTKAGSDGNSSASFRLLLLVLMVLQNTATVLVGRYTRASATPEDIYVVNHLIVTCEAAKVRKFHR